MVPNECVACKHLRVAPTDDLTHGVVGAGVGRIHTRVFVLPSVAVIGECAIHPTAVAVDGQPFRAVHFGGPQPIAGLSGFDQHFALVGKAIGHGERSIAVHQGQPSPAAIGIKLCHIQGAVVQQFAVGSCTAWRDLVAADEFVDVFKPCVFPRIHHRAAIA